MRKHFSLLASFWFVLCLDKRNASLRARAHTHAHTHTHTHTHGKILFKALVFSSSRAHLCFFAVLAKSEMVMALCRLRDDTVVCVCGERELGGGGGGEKVFGF